MIKDATERDDELLLPPIGQCIPNTTSVRHVRCGEPDAVGGFFCGREKDHDGPHSVAILNTDRCYVWPRK